MTARQFLFNGPTILIGPVTWQPNADARGGKRWYFIVADSDKAGRIYVHLCRDEENTAGSVEEARQHLLAAQLQRKSPLVVHVFESELDMARMAESVWPGERTTRLRKAVEAERGASA